MRYRNTKTGAILDSLCVISGGDWIQEVPKVEEEPEEIVKEVVKEKPGKKGK